MSGSDWSFINERDKVMAAESSQRTDVFTLDKSDYWFPFDAFCYYSDDDGRTWLVRGEDRNGNGQLDEGEDFDRDGNLDEVDTILAQDTSGHRGCLPPLDGYYLVGESSCEGDHAGRTGQASVLHHHGDLCVLDVRLCDSVPVL